jgi:methylthioribose-1-phosphate isomerase
MAIRGAPAIGVAAALGIALGVRNSRARGRGAGGRVRRDLQGDGGHPAHRGQPLLGHRSDAPPLRGREARAAPRCAMRLWRRRGHRGRGRGRLPAHGDLGAELIPSAPASSPTATPGALATAGYGTALGVIRPRPRQGKIQNVSGRRDAALPAGRAAHRLGADPEGIPTTLIADNMAGTDGARRGGCGGRGRGPHRGQRRRGQQDRHLHRGRARQRNGVPFYVAAPVSTIDLRTPPGRHPIEERPADESHPPRRPAAGPEGVACATPPST